MKKVRHFSLTALIYCRRIRISGSRTGGIKETQDCIDFCAKHKIQSTIQVQSVLTYEPVQNNTGRRRIDLCAKHKILLTIQVESVLTNEPV